MSEDDLSRFLADLGIDLFSAFRRVRCDATGSPEAYLAALYSVLRAASYTLEVRLGLPKGLRLRAARRAPALADRMIERMRAHGPE